MNGWSYLFCASAVPFVTEFIFLYLTGRPWGPHAWMGLVFTAFFMVVVLGVMGIKKLTDGA